MHCYLECAASLSLVWACPCPDKGCRVRPVINARPAHSTVSLFSISLTPLTETRSVWLATLSRAVTLSHSLSIKYFPLLSMKFYTDGLTLVFDISVRGLLTLCRLLSMFASFANTETRHRKHSKPSTDLRGIGLRLGGAALLANTPNAIRCRLMNHGVNV